MLNWFSKRTALNLQVDIHSHLLPGLDDGVKSYEESLEILRFFEQNGFKKLVTTPHVYPDIYPNTSDGIRERHQELQLKIREAGLEIQVESAAEYFVDQEFLHAIREGGEVLSFGADYVLIETGFTNRPLIFEEVVFELKSTGYTPVLAHPERYEYLDKDFSWLKQIRQRGVLLQLSLPSLVGAYGPIPQRVAKKLLNLRMIDFLGSDIHRKQQLPTLHKALRLKIKPAGFLNNELI